MASSQAARRYARALFSLANEENQLAAVRGDLQNLRSLFDDNAELREALLTPLRPAKERKAVMGAVAQRAEIAPVVSHFLSFLIDQRRLVDFGAIQSEFERLADEASGLLTAQITAAAPLDDSSQGRLRQALAARTGRDVQLEIAVDPSLIGGIVAKVGDTVYDGSVRTQLARLQTSLSTEG